MRSTLPHGWTVTRLRGTRTPNAYGDAEWDWSAPDRLTITDVAIAPRVADEEHQAGRDGVTFSHTAYVYGRIVDINAYDRLETPDGLFNVVDDPGRWRSPFSGREGMTVRLERTDG